MRALDIGPGPKRRIPGFEGLDAVRSPLVDHVGDCRAMPKSWAGAFDVVHASHVIEHIEWAEVEATIKEWARVVAPGGRLEVWFPDGELLMRTLLAYDADGTWPFPLPSGSAKHLHEGDPYKFCVGELMNYDLRGNPLQKHRSIITPSYMTILMARAGLTDIRRLAEPEERRGAKHGWSNCGIVGSKV